MRPPAIHVMIYDFLYKNMLKDNGFLELDEIGVHVFGNGWHYDRQKLHKKSIKNAMGWVRKLARENGHEVIADRLETRNNKNRFNRVMGWKIATPKDTREIGNEIVYKNDQVISITSSANLFMHSVKEKGLIKSDESKPLQLEK